METDKIVKLLNLTRSDNDNEALLAIRRANAIVNKANSSWDVLLAAREESRGYDPPPPRRPPPPPPRKKEFPPVETMLSVCLRQVKGQARGFIESLAIALDDYGSLTEKQESALRKFYSNCVK